MTVRICLKGEDRYENSIRAQFLRTGGGSAGVPGQVAADSGDAGHAASFGYPVRYQIVDCGFMDLVEGSGETLAKLRRACKQLREEGIRGVVADCGLVSLYQRELGEELLFVGSSLCQIPMIWQMIGHSGVIGVITGHSGLLRESHLRHSGWREEMELAIQGMENQPHFSEVVIRGEGSLDPARMEAEVIAAAQELQAQIPGLRAVVLECSNLATYSRAVSEALGLPVFDTISAANLIAYGLCPPHYC